MDIFTLLHLGSIQHHLYSNCVPYNEDDLMYNRSCKFSNFATKFNQNKICHFHLTQDY
jgi:hypothetical protein